MEEVMEEYGDFYDAFITIISLTFTPRPGRIFRNGKMARGSLTASTGSTTATRPMRG